MCRSALHTPALAGHRAKGEKIRKVRRWLCSKTKPISTGFPPKLLWNNYYSTSLACTLTRTKTPDQRPVPNKGLARWLGGRCVSRLTENHTILKDKGWEQDDAGALLSHTLISWPQGHRVSRGAQPFHLPWLSLTRFPPYSHLSSLCSSLSRTQLAQRGASCLRHRQLFYQTGKSFMSSMSPNALNCARRPQLWVPAQGVKQKR